MRKYAARSARSAKFDRCVRAVKARPRSNARNAYAICTAALRKKTLPRSNPSASALLSSVRYVIDARKGSGPTLRLVAGLKFAQKGSPIIFLSRISAAVTARALERQYDALRQYRLTILAV